MKFFALLLGLSLMSCQTQQQTASTKSTAPKNATASGGRTVWVAPPTGSLLGGGYTSTGNSSSASPTPAVGASKALPQPRQ